MKNEKLATVRSWLDEPLSAEMSSMLARLRRALDVQQIAIMPDAHVAMDVCVGTVFATRSLVYPQAVGSDIGCGMLALAFDIEAKALADGAVAGRVLAEMGRSLPTVRRHRAATVPMPADLMRRSLSDRSLEGFRKDAGVLQFATLGSGNHFIELQADESDDRLWLMIHSGSRLMGQAIGDHHVGRGERVAGSLRVLDAGTPAGQAYLHDAQWARDYAAANRIAMAHRVATILRAAVGARTVESTLCNIDHNHVVRERHGENVVYVHRKGAMAAGEGVAGAVPGSMGTLSYHVTGRGCAEAMDSSAHGAGRQLSRHQAKLAIGERRLHQEMEGVWFDYRRAEHLRDEAPSAYKDVRAVMRAQRDLVRLDRTLRPVLNYKGC